MKILSSIKFVATLFLYTGIITGSIVSAQDIDAKLTELETRLDAIINKKHMLDTIVKMYNQRKPECFSLLKKYIAENPDAADIKRAKQLADEWTEKKKTELLVHHKSHAGGEWKFYAFTVSEDMEKLLKDIAELQWKVNEMNDKYTQVINAVNTAKKNLELDKAKQLLNLARRMLNENHKIRKNTNKTFEHLLGGSNKPFYSTTLNANGMWMNGVTIEFLFFIVEVAGNGKYVRAWTGKVKGGSEVIISGSKATINTTE